MTDFPVQTNALDASSDQLGNSECLGGEQLLQLLKNYSRNRNLKTSVTVGVIGYPNVGKSSLINSLVRTRAVEVGAQAGITKVAQEVHLDKKVKLLDCPGIVFAKDENDVSVILRNHVKLSAVTDCVSLHPASSQHASLRVALGMHGPSLWFMGRCCNV